MHNPRIDPTFQDVPLRNRIRYNKTPNFSPVSFQLSASVQHFRLATLLAAMEPTDDQLIGRMDRGYPRTFKKCWSAQTMNIGSAKIRALQDLVDYFNFAEAW
tara:strand:- start:19 stop:324 length:306 start_codon:yes stop_codon:yes gene_type:complete